MASAPSSVFAASTGTPERSPFQLGTLPSQPYYPSHFMHGLLKFFYIMILLYLILNFLPYF